MSVELLKDKEIQRDVMDELDWDPEIEVTDVGVEVDDGIVTLTGTVETLQARWAAEQAALRVFGVHAVANDLAVIPVGLASRTDAEIARAVANTLEWTSGIPHDRIKIRVSDGTVTLTGEVAWHHQRDSALEVVRKIEGVRSVNDLIEVRQQSFSEIDVQGRIERALVRNAEIDARQIHVHDDNGEIWLTGRVRSWAEKNAASNAARRARGVSAVVNDLEISPE